jgi:transposase
MTKRTVHTPGRKPRPIPENLLSIYDEMNTTEMARHYQVSRATISKWLKIKRQEETAGVKRLYDRSPVQPRLVSIKKR